MEGQEGREVGREGEGDREGGEGGREGGWKGGRRGRRGREDGERREGGRVEGREEREEGERGGRRTKRGREGGWKGGRRRRRRKESVTTTHVRATLECIYSIPTDRQPGLLHVHVNTFGVCVDTYHTMLPLLAAINACNGLSGSDCIIREDARFVHSMP